MSDELKQEASGNGGEATSCEPYAPLGCSAFIVRDRSGRHLNYLVETEERALAIVEYFTLKDPASRFYITQNPAPLARTTPEDRT